MRKKDEGSYSLDETKKRLYWVSNDVCKFASFNITSNDFLSSIDLYLSNSFGIYIEFVSACLLSAVNNKSRTFFVSIARFLFKYALHKFHVFLNKPFSDGLSNVFFKFNFLGIFAIQEN